MKLRIFCLINMIVSVVVGAVVYYLFREETIIHDLLITPIASIWADVDFSGTLFVKFFLPDLLWSYGLCAGLMAIYAPERNGAWVVSGVVATLGVSWEIGQLSGLLPGTFDLTDCAAYLIGAIIFNLFFQRRREKSK